MPSKPSTSKTKPTPAPKPKQSAQSKAEKRKQTNAYKAAKAAAVAKATLDLDQEGEGEEGEDEDEDEGASGDESNVQDNTEESSEPEQEKWYRSKCGKYVYIRDTNGEFTRWTIKAKPIPKDVGKNWNIQKFMELDEEGEKETMYNAINTLARTLLMVEVKDLEDLKWSNVTTEMRNRMNYKLKKRFAYLHRFKANCVSEELCKRILRNYRDTQARIERAGGHTEWKEKEKAKRKARLAKKIDEAVAKSGSKAKQTAKVSPMQTPVDDELPTTSTSATSSTADTSSKDNGKDSDQPANDGTENKKRAMDANKKGKKRAEPTTDDEDHQIASETDQPQVSTRKRRLQIDDDTDSESHNLSVAHSLDTAVEATSLSKKRKLAPGADEDQDNVSVASKSTEPVPSSDHSSKRVRRINLESDSEDEELDEQVREEGAGVPVNKGGNGGEEGGEKSDNGSGKGGAEDDKEGSEEDTEDEDEEELARQMEELKKRMAVSKKKRKTRNLDPLPATPSKKLPQKSVVDDVPPANPTIASNSSAIPASNQLASTPNKLPPASSTIASNAPPSANHDESPAPKKTHVRPNIRPVPIELDGETTSILATAGAGELHPKEPTPTPALPKGKGAKKGAKATSRKVKEELIESVDAGSNTTKVNHRRNLRSGR